MSSWISTVSLRLRQSAEPRSNHLFRCVSRPGVAALYRCGLLRRAFRRRRGLRILCYHGVCADEAVGRPGVPAHFVGVGEFARQLQIARRFGPAVLLSDVIDTLGQPPSADVPAVAITFDDVPACSFAHARPILEAHGLRASFFLATGHIQSGRLFWSDVLRLASQHPDLIEPADRNVLDALLSTPGAHKRLTTAALHEKLGGIAHTLRARLDPALVEMLRPITWDEARQLAQAGHDVGGHTVDHAILTNEPTAARNYQIRQCVADLETHLGRRPVGFAYPNGGPGDFGPADAALLRELGLRYAATTRPGFADKEDPFELPRVCIGAAHTGPRFALELSGLLDRRAERQRGWR